MKFHLAKWGGEGELNPGVATLVTPTEWEEKNIKYSPGWEGAPPCFEWSTTKCKMC